MKGDLCILEQNLHFNAKPIVCKINKDCWEVVTHSLNGGEGRKWRYPRVKRGNNPKLASRYIYEKFIGPIPKGLYILHSCDNPLCINPNHLRVGTPQDNVDDMMKRKRASVGSKRKNSKLNEDIVTKLRNGEIEVSEESARKYGVNIQALINAKRGRTWKHMGYKYRPRETKYPKHVELDTKTQKYVSRITHKGKRYYVGMFDDAMEAHKAAVKKKQEVLATG